MEEQVKVPDNGLKEKSTMELKAMAYDFGVIIGEYKQMLTLVNQEILERIQKENRENQANKTN